jgi:tetratricopeptide (TPR) repeat protein
MTFPLVLLLWEATIRRTDGVGLYNTILSDHFPFWLVLVAWATWALWHPRYSALAQFSFQLRPLWDNLLSQVHATTHALLLFFQPWNQNFDHDLPEYHSLLDWPLPLDLLLLSVTVAAALGAARRLPLAAFGVGWFFLQLAPISLIPRADLLSERNLYLASIGLVLALVAAGSHLTKWLATVLPYARLIRVGTVSAMVALVLLLGLSTHHRNLLYRDEVSLWADTVRKSPHKARPHNNLGHAYAMQGDWDRAIEEFRTAARLDPEYVIAQKNLRDAYLHQVGRE